MIAIEQLRYVRLGTADLAAAADFAQRILGLQVVDKTDDQVAFRSDYRDHTLVYFRDSKPSCIVALELRDSEALEAAAEALRTEGYKVTRGSNEEAARRKVRQFISFPDASGNVFELVVRPQHSGWRYFPSRDAGILGLEDVALRSTANGADEKLWTKIFNGRVSDWVGDASYIRFDTAHHRLAFHPAPKSGILAVEYKVEDVDLIMQNSYFLRSAQVRIVDGPGRRPTSNQLFLTFAGPDGVLFSYVAEGDTIDEARHRPRQFAKTRRSFCNWGSDCDIPELQ